MKMIIFLLLFDNSIQSWLFYITADCCVTHDCKVHYSLPFYNDAMTTTLQHNQQHITMEWTMTGQRLDKRERKKSFLFSIFILERGGGGGIGGGGFEKTHI